MTVVQKKICSLLIALCLFVSLCPAALADGLVTAYDLWVGGVQVTSENRSDITAAINALSPGSARGAAVFDPADSTLTLNDFSFSGTGYALDSETRAALYSELDTLTISASGTNSFAETGGVEFSYGAYTRGAVDVALSGSGTLSFTSTDTVTRNVGLFLYKGDLSVQGGTLTCRSGTASHLSTGVWCLSGSINVAADASLVGEGSSAAMTRGVCASDELYVSGGSVRGTAGEGSIASHGISVRTLKSDNSQSQIVATAPGGKGEAVGALMYGLSEINAGSLTATAGASEQLLSLGIFASQGLTVNGGTVTAKGETCGFHLIPQVKTENTIVRTWYGNAEAQALSQGAQSYLSLLNNSDRKFARIQVSDALPNTGDAENTALWLGLMAAGLAGTAIFAARGKKRAR